MSKDCGGENIANYLPKILPLPSICRKCLLNRGQISVIDHLNPSPLTAVSSIYQFPLDYCPDRTSNNSEIVITELDFLNLLCKSRYFRRGNHNTAKTVKGRDFPDSQNGHFHFEHPRSAVQNTETTINYVLASNEFYLTNRRSTMKGCLMIFILASGLLEWLFLVKTLHKSNMSLNRKAWTSN